MAAEMVAEVAVVDAVAVGGVADDRVEDVLQVPAQLVAPPGHRGQLHQCVAAGRIASHRYRQLDLRQPPQVRQRRQRFGARQVSAVEGEFFQGVIDDLITGDSAHHGQVAFRHFMRLQLPAQFAGGLAVQGKEDNPRGRPVEAVHRPDPLPHHAAHQQHERDRLLAGQVGRVNHHPRRLVHGNELIVPIEDGDESVTVEGGEHGRPF